MLANLTDLEKIIELMTKNTLQSVKFGDIEVVKNLHTVKTKPEKHLPMKAFDDLSEDDQLFDPLKDITDGK